MTSKSFLGIALCLGILSDLSGFAITDSTLTKPRQATEWIEVDQTEGITYYERWITMSADHETRERKGVFYVVGDRDNIESFICRSENIQNWMVGAMKAEQIQSLSPDTWISYVLYDAPWPFKNRELIARYHISHVPEFNETHVSIISDPIEYNTGEDAIRIENYEAKWLVTELEINTFKIEFSALTDIPPLVPLWLQDPITQKMFRKNLENFITLTSTQDADVQIELAETID